jgi:hypothetical protein
MGDYSQNPNLYKSCGADINTLPLTSSWMGLFCYEYDPDSQTGMRLLCQYRHGTLDLYDNSDADKIICCNQYIERWSSHGTHYHHSILTDLLVGCAGCGVPYWQPGTIPSGWKEAYACVSDPGDYSLVANGDQSEDYIRMTPAECINTCTAYNYSIAASMCPVSFTKAIRLTLTVHSTSRSDV